MQYDVILNYWFGDLRNNDYFPARKAKIWYRKDESVDSYIKNTFGSIWREIANGNICWSSPRGLLATIVALDQFSRHIHRDKPQSFACDKDCLDLCLKGLDSQKDKELYVVERAFFYMPLQHCENIEIQKKSVAYFDKLTIDAHPNIKEQISGFHEYAIKHYKIIEKFGRFPHRNAILQRASSPQEVQYLKKAKGF